MVPRRRLSLQLTPLLDLLLIVMFSQYIENRERTARAETDRIAAAETLQERLRKLDDEYSARRRDLEQRFEQDRRTVEELRRTYDDRFQSILEQHHQIGSLLAETLNLPGAALEEILKLRTTGQSESADRLETAVSNLRQLMQARGEDVFRGLIRIDEMQKHVSVWEAHVLSSGQTVLTDGQQSFRVDFSSEHEFATRLYEASKSFAEPRTLIIVLLSWGDAQAGQRQMAAAAMPQLMDLLRKDAAGTRWYDFSIVGFRSTGPVVSVGQAR